MFKIVSDLHFVGFEITTLVPFPWPTIRELNKNLCKPLHLLRAYDILQIETELKSLAASYPNLATLVTDIGKSYKGRTIHAIKVFILSYPYKARVIIKPK